MEKEIKRPRADRREILRLNEKFDSLLTPCFEEMDLHGDTDAVAEFIGIKVNRWEHICYNHNRNRKNKLHADPGALMKQIKERMKRDEKLEAADKIKNEKAAFDCWVAKVSMRFPRLMWKWNLIAKIRKDYVKEKYEKFQGKSPVGSWV